MEPVEGGRVSDDMRCGADPVLDDPTPGMHIWGWMSPAELTWLGEQAAKMQTVVEIGSLRGRSSYALTKSCPGTVYCIDPWNDAGWIAWNDAVGSVFDNVVPIRAASPAAADLVPDRVDMVFIDGAHDYDSVAADIECWLPKTNVLLCGHDYPPDSEVGEDGRAYPDVKRAVDELIGVDSITIAPGTAIWAVWL